MDPQIIGISDSPIKNSKTDRLIKVVLDVAGCESEFIKLSKITIRSCFDCRQCATDTIRKVPDDFQERAYSVSVPV